MNKRPVGAKHYKQSRR